MTGKPRRRALRTAASRAAGFTLVELAVTIVIISILSVIGIANFIEFRHRAGYASCVTNQRHALEASLLYISTSSPGTTSFDISFLIVGGFLAREVGECPASTVEDFNDYTIDIVDNEVSAIACKIEPVKHTWSLP